MPLPSSLLKSRLPGPSSAVAWFCTKHGNKGGIHMESFRKGLLFPVALIIAGVAIFFLYLFIIGHDPDERPLTLTQWVIGGILIGPGFGYLLRWRKAKDREKAKLD
jgi:hypothetical protein